MWPRCLRSFSAPNSRLAILSIALLTAWSPIQASEEDRHRALTPHGGARTLLVVDGTQNRVVALHEDMNPFWEKAIEDPVDAWVSSTGELWISCQGGRVEVIDPGRYQPTRVYQFDEPPRFRITQQGLTLLFPQQGRVLRFDPKSDSFPVIDEDLGPFGDWAQVGKEQHILTRPEHRALDIHGPRGWTRRLTIDCIPVSIDSAGEGRLLIGGENPPRVVLWDMSTMSPESLPVWIGFTPVSSVTSDTGRHAFATRDGTIYVIGWTHRVIAQTRGFREIRRLRWLTNEKARFQFASVHRDRPLRDRHHRTRVNSALRNHVARQHLVEWGLSQPISYPSALPLIDRWRQDSWRFHEQSKAIADKMVDEAASLIGLGEVRSHLLSPTPKIPFQWERSPTLLDALEAVFREFHQPWQPRDRRRWEKTLSSLPKVLDHQLGLAVQVLSEVVREAEGAFSKLTPTERRELGTITLKDSPTHHLVEASTRIDADMLRRASARLLAIGDAIGSALSVIPKKELQDLKSLRFSTPIGDIALGGLSEDKHQGQCLLLVDMGGDDIYLEGVGGATPDQPVTLVIDIAGDDRYESIADWSQGAAEQGVALQMDLKGNDVYRAQSRAQGIGVYGHGFLVDRQGQDSFDGQHLCQGVGIFGSGCLLDLGMERDSYRLEERGQGLGSASGVGLLFDLGGDDAYESTGVYGGTQGASLALSWPDSDSPLGGLGWVIDGHGQDRYRAMTRSLGYSQANGIGIHSDLGGDDVYRLEKDGLGRSHAYGLSLCFDGGGADRYDALARALGYGSEGGFGWFVESGGNDVYGLLSQGLGQATEDGGGLFLDFAGDDHVRAIESSRADQEEESAPAQANQNALEVHFGPGR